MSLGLCLLSVSLAQAQLSLIQSHWYCHWHSSSSSSSDTSAGQRFPPHNRTLGVGEFRVGGGVHDSYTFQCGLVGSFTSPGIAIGIDTR